MTVVGVEKYRRRGVDYGIRIPFRTLRIIHTRTPIVLAMLFKHAEPISTGQTRFSIPQFICAQVAPMRRGKWLVCARTQLTGIGRVVSFAPRIHLELQRGRRAADSDTACTPLPGTIVWGTVESQY